MKATLGYGASTCSYADWLHADLIVFFGSNRPTTSRSRRSTSTTPSETAREIAVVNPYREPGLERYWVPSIAGERGRSARKLADHWFEVHTGGDLAFLVGVLRALVEMRRDRRGICRARARSGSTAARAAAMATRLGGARGATSGASTRRHAAVRAAARSNGPNAMFVWSMGLRSTRTASTRSTRSSTSALARGLAGRPGRGLVPIRGHSGVQGGAEVGCAPGVDAATADALDPRMGISGRRPDRAGRRPRWSRPRPAATSTSSGWSAAIFSRRSRTKRAPPRRWRGRASASTRTSCSRPSMLVESDGDVLLLPAATRYESPGGGTETSTERRIIFSPEIPGRRIGSARPEWEVFGDVDGARAAGARRRISASRAPPRSAPRSRARSRSMPASNASRRRAISCSGAAQRSTPMAASPRRTAKRISASRCRFGRRAPPGEFRVSTRRGKQFNSMVQRGADPLTGAGGTMC